MDLQKAKFEYLLRLGDSSLIIGHRLSEWCGHGPILEEDIALTNIALDFVGNATSLLTYAAQIEGKGRTEDDLAYMRDERDYRNLLICEQPNGDYAATIARQFLFDAYMFFLYEELKSSKDETIAAIAVKSHKEITYHLRHTTQWMLRLGDGTAESQHRILNAMQLLSPWISEMFLPVDFDYEASSTGAGIQPEILKNEWFDRVNNVLVTAMLPEISSENKPLQILSGKKGVHSEQLTDLLAEMQILQRTYPGATW